MGKGYLEVRFIDDVPDKLRFYIAAAASAFTREIDLRHEVTAFVVPAPAVSVGKGVGFGVFLPDRRPAFIKGEWQMVPHPRPSIVIAGGLAKVVRPAAEGRRAVAESLAHELVHYEQWRDGRLMNHRGVEARALALVARLKVKS